MDHMDQHELQPECNEKQAAFVKVRGAGHCANMVGFVALGKMKGKALVKKQVACKSACVCVCVCGCVCVCVQLTCTQSAGDATDTTFDSSSLAQGQRGNQLNFKTLPQKAAAPGKERPEALPSIINYQRQLSQKRLN